jgi:hypothetical protein
MSTSNFLSGFGPSNINDLAFYLYNLDQTRSIDRLPYFVDKRNDETFASGDYVSLGESWSHHGAISKRYAHKSICFPGYQSIEWKRTIGKDDGADKQTSVNIVTYPRTQIQLMYVRLGYNTDIMVLRCMVHAINAPAPVIGYLNKQEMYAATTLYSNIFQIPESSNILKYRLEFETTAMAALKKMCGYNTNNYSEVYIDYIDSIFCNCKDVADVNVPNDQFVVPFMSGLCRDAIKMTIDGYPDICACLGKGALDIPSNECNTGTEAEQFKCKCASGGLTEEEQWQCDFNNDKIRFICAKKNCVGDTTGRVYQFAPNPTCERYNICEQTLTANALKFDITNLRLCCGDTECADVTGSGTTGSETAATGSGTATTPGLSTSALCAASTPLVNDSPIHQRRQKATFAWIALIVLLLLLVAVFFK